MHPALILLLVVAAALAGFFLLRRCHLDEIFAAEFNFLNINGRIVGTVFGLFLAFTIILGWGRYTEARRTLYNEVTCLSLMWRSADVFPGEVRDRLHHILTAYTQSVIEDEWPAMAQDQESRLTQQRYLELWAFYTSYTPETESQKLFYSQSVSKLNEMGVNRRLRHLYCQTTFIAPVVIFLLFGGMVMVGISYCFPVRNVHFHVLVIAILTVIISFGIYLAYELQNPFSGYIVIGPEAFQDLLTSFAQRR